MSTLRGRSATASIAPAKSRLAISKPPATLPKVT